MHDDSKPRKPRPARALRRRPARRRAKRESADRFLSVGHPSVQTALKGLVTELHRVGTYIDELVLHMEQGNLPEVPEAREAQEENRKAIAELLRVVDGGSH
jgi:hypothetical protein